MGYSKQRELILSVLKGTRSHPTASEIYTEVRKLEPKISLGTVYRNLDLLSTNGAILRIDTEHNSVHYDGFTHSHYHFVCNDCRKVSDLSISPINIDREIEAETGGTVTSHTLVVYGKCKNCK